MADPKAPECRKPPHGWVCTRDRGHHGPCAAWPSDAPEVTGEGWRVILHLFHEATTGCTMDELTALLSAHGLHIVSEADRKVLAEVDAMFTRSPQWFENHLPTLHKLLNDRERAHVAAVMARRSGA